MSYPRWCEWCWRVCPGLDEKGLCQHGKQSANGAAGQERKVEQPEKPAPRDEELLPWEW
jgi:hypothetical protein